MTSQLFAGHSGGSRGAAAPAFNVLGAVPSFLRDGALNQILLKALDGGKNTKDEACVMITKVKKRCIWFIALALAVTVFAVTGKEAASETAPISLGQYIDKVVSSHEVTESSLKGSLIKYLDASDVKTKRLFGSATFSRTGGFAFDGDVSVDSIVVFLSGDKIYNIKFNFSSRRCMTINELDASIGAFSGHYPPPVDSRDSSIFEMQHISGDGMTLYRASLTKSKFVLAPSCVNGLSVTLERNK